MDFIYDPSLVLYLPLSELDGNSFKSRDAYGHLCVAIGAAWRHNGRYFDGIDDQIDCGNPLSLRITKSMSLEAWVKTTDTLGLFISKQKPTSPYYGWGFGMGGNNLRAWFYGATSGYSTGTTIINDDVFHHLTAVYDSSVPSITLYVNGVDDNATIGAAPSTSTTSVSNSVIIGNGPAPFGGATIGTIGEVRIFNRVLTPQEIQRNYLTTKRRYQ